MIQLKTTHQIDLIRQSCKLLAQLFEALPSQVEEGKTTADIDKFCYDFITDNGGKPAFLNYQGYPGTACISLNDEVIHGIPSPKRRLKQGDLVSIDLGINLNGYFSDSARTFIIGETTAEREALVRVTEESLYRGIEAAQKSGARIHDISSAIYTYATTHGFAVVRDYCGHGVGLALHEDPQVPNFVSPRGANPRLRPGMVLAIEPMINLGTKGVKVLRDGWTVVTIDGEPSAHFEHTIAVTPTGIEILTQL